MLSLTRFIKATARSELFNPDRRPDADWQCQQHGDTDNPDGAKKAGDPRLPGKARGIARKEVPAQALQPRG